MRAAPLSGRPERASAPQSRLFQNTHPRVDCWPGAKVVERLREIIRSYEATITAFSAGVDSTLVAVVAQQELGERALICSGVWDLEATPHADHVKLVRTVNHAAVFPICRAVAHHGGSGTTAAGVRAGVPTLILWVGADQPFWVHRWSD